MPKQATCTFVIDSWDEGTWHDQDGVKLQRAKVTKTFRGDLDGRSTVELLSVQGPSDASRAYVAVERIEGRLHDRAGSFVLLHAASPDSVRWTVVPETATEGLRGLRGSAQIAITPDGGHSMTLDYDLDD